MGGLTTESFDESTDIEAGKMAKGNTLKNASNESYDSNNQERRFAAKFVGDWVCQKGTSYSSGLHDADKIGGEISTSCFRNVVEAIFPERSLESDIKSLIDRCTS